MDEGAFSDWPVVLVWLFFLAGALMRGTALYWIGRGARAADSRFRGVLDRPSVQKAEDVVRRVGAPVVALSYLTVGVQSAVNIAAGALRMPARRFVPALLLGAMAWATIYTTVGWAVVETFWGSLGTRWLLAGAAAVALLAGATIYARQRVGLRSLADGDDTVGSHQEGT